VLVIGLGASVGHGQWLETRITLPDSLGGATYPTCFTTDTSERYVYIGDESGSLYVVDAEAGTRVAKFSGVYAVAVCANTREDKVYAADYARNRVVAISCATNQVVATIPLGAAGLPTALCYNSVDNKIYAASYDGGDLTVIDGSPDSVIKTIHLGKNPASLCYNPASNRVFCVSETLWVGDALTVIDGANDSVVAAYAGAYHGPFAVSAVANKVYVGGGSIGVLVLDGTTGAVLDSLCASADVMCLNPRTQKLYTIGKAPCQVMIFDCAADTLIDWFYIRATQCVYSIACDTATGKVYATVDSDFLHDALVVIDGVTDTIAATIPGPHQGELLVSSKLGCVYSTDRYGPELAVYDTGTESPLRTIFIGGSSGRMCYGSTDGKVYYVNYSNVLGEVGAIDAATNQPVGRIQVGPYPQHVIWHAPTNRVYCSGWSSLTVIDPTADTATKVLPLNSGLMCSAPRLNKVYVETPSTVNVIDCRNDSVIKAIPVPIEPMWSMCYVAYDKLYIGGWGAVCIIDCIGDTLIRTYPLNVSRLVANLDGKRVYCWRPYSLSTFDTAGDTLVAEVPWDASGGTDLLYVPGLDKVYCVCGGNGQHCILVADGATDSVIAYIQIPVVVPMALGYDSANGLVYCGHDLDSIITLVDSRTDSVVGSLSTGLIAGTFVTVPAHNRVYVGGGGNSFIPVIRTDPLGVEEATRPLSKKSLGPTLVSRNSPLVVHQPSVLLDAVGRKVLNLKPGPHGLTGRRAGVYFLRNCTEGNIEKIILVD